MEPDRFDSLVQTLTRPGSRRHALALALASTLLPAATSAARESATCLAFGKRCTPKRKGTRRQPACKKCCSGLGTTGADGKTRCSDKTCLTDGTCVFTCDTVNFPCGPIGGNNCSCFPARNGSGNACLSKNACNCAADCATCAPGTICVVNTFLRNLCPEDQPLFCCDPCIG